jgi:hypothetical protein
MPLSSLIRTPTASHALGTPIGGEFMLILYRGVHLALVVLFSNSSAIQSIVICTQSCLEWLVSLNSHNLKLKIWRVVTRESLQLVHGRPSLVPTHHPKSQSRLRFEEPKEPFLSTLMAGMIGIYIAPNSTHYLMQLLPPPSRLRSRCQVSLSSPVSLYRSTRS